MSWSYNAIGPVSEVRKVVEASTLGDTAPEIEQQQFKSVKETVLATLAIFPDEREMRVNCSGYANWNNEGVTNINCKMEVTTI